MKRLAAVLVMVGVVWGQAQPARRPAARKPAPVAPLESWPIREIRVDGVRVYSEAQVLELSGLKVGGLATKENFERARDRVLASGVFESFGWKYEALAEGGGFIATLQVTEPAQYFPWALDRVPVERGEFAARVKKSLPLFAEKIPPSDMFMGKIVAVLQAMAAEKGIHEPMAGRVTILGTDQITVVFGPKAAPPNVAEVRFTGARAIDARYLVKALSEVAIGTPYVEPNFRVFLDHQIKPMYEAAGRLKAAFPKLAAEPSKTMQGMVVTVQVEEGELYALDRVVVTGTGLSEQDLLDEGQFKTGQTVNFSEIGKGLNRILDRLKEGGYMKAAYQAKRALNDEKKTVDVLVEVEAGPQYLFRTLVVKGLDLESEPALRKLWALKPGDVFKKSYPDMFLGQIRERGVFDNLGETKAEVKADDAALRVDVVLTFKGAPPVVEKKRPEGA
ncbi:MAG: hypothetical protein HY858_16910 [Candidatus Solibacter usitatus]|nr:hypothetical protein [Candidatus Solibacter usitatus]